MTYNQKIIIILKKGYYLSECFLLKKNGRGKNVKTHLKLILIYLTEKKNTGVLWYTVWEFYEVFKIIKETPYKLSNKLFKKPTKQFLKCKHQ